ncbi:hypothetical protein JCM9279_001184 [Rhodotorula babjevae]
MPPIELHVDTTATADVAIHPSSFPPDTVAGDFIAVRPVLRPGSKGKAKDRPLLYKVDKAPDLDELAAAAAGDGPAGLAARRRGKAQVTVSPVVAQGFSWVKNRIEVELSLIPSPPPARLCASHVELYFNNLYLSRPDGFALSLALTDKVLHVGQRVALPGSGARLRVGDMWSATPGASLASTKRGSSSSSSSSHAKNMRLEAAYITDDTKFVFRSESARAYIFVEVSQELWQFEEDGSSLLEKCELFLHELWSHYSGKMSTEAEDKRSKGIPTSHVVSIVLFGRVLYDDEHDAEEDRAPLQRLEDGTLYRDFYKVVVDVTPSPPSSIIHQVALALRRWQSTVLLRTRPDGSERLSGRLAHAHESPVLEATNLALNSFEEHWIDRDLQRTGQEIVVLTAGTTFYQVEKSLLRLTTERMLFHGCGLDLVSLSKMPLHTIPLFQFRSPDPSAAELAIAVNDSSVALAAVRAGESVATTGTTHPLGLSFYSSSARSPVGTHHRFPMSATASGAYRPSSLRQQHAFPASPPLRDPRAPTMADARSDSAAAAAAASNRIAPIQVPDDQRDPLYFDPPPPRSSTSTAAQHARGPSGTAASPFPATPSSVSSATHPVHAPSASLAPTGGVLETSLYYHEPMFVFPHFFGTQIDKPHRVDRFMPRARCYELMSQGVTERVPIALPLLRLERQQDGAGVGSAAASSGAAAGADGESAEGAEVGEGYLDELERRQLRRERYDALALGARDPAELAAAGAGAIGAGGWADERESGATTSGTSGGSGSAGESGWGRSVAESEAEEDERRRLARRARDEARLAEMSETDEGEDEARSRVARRKSSAGGALGIGVGAQGASAGSAGAGHSRRSSLAGSRHRAGSVSTASSSSVRHASIAEDSDDDRGRRSGRETPKRKLGADESVGRSKTPVARVRAPSMSASIRTLASGLGRGEAPSAPGSTTGSAPALRKASTPALIARLTGGPAPAAVSNGGGGPRNAPTAAPSPAKGGWLSFLGGRGSSASKTSSPAAQVAVARVDVQANLRPEEAASADKPDSIDDDSGSVESPVLAHSSASLRPSSRSRSRADAKRKGAGSGKTQPISIGSKLGPAGSSSAAAGGGDKRQHGGKGGAGGGDGGSGGGSVREAGRMSSSLKAYEPGTAMRKAFGISGGKVSVASRFNPSKPGKRSVGLADQARRWAGILVVEGRSLRLGVKWRSITRGAILPMTTDYLPSAKVLSSQYSDFRYTVPTSAVTSSFLLRTDHPKRSHILTLVTELICQRLAQGFQICTPANASGALDAINVATTKTLPDVLRDIQEGEVTAVYLSLSNQIHRIWYDRRTQTVCVKILRRRRTWAKTDYAYSPLIWTRGSDNYAPTRLSLPYPVMMDPRHDWQHADRLVAGAEKPDAAQSVRYRRTRLVLLPMSRIPDRDYIVGANKALQGVNGGAISDATIQAQGFYVLLELIENARWAPAGVDKEPLSIVQTTLDAPSWASSVAKQNSTADPSSSSSAASSAAPTSPPTNAAAGTSATQPRTWLSRMQSRAGGVGKGDETATAPGGPALGSAGTELELPPPVAAAAGASAVGATPNKDAVLAALSRSEASSSAGAGAGAATASSSSSLPDTSPSLGSVGPSEVSGDGAPASTSSKLPAPARTRVQMTHAVVLDLDPSRRSDRSERVLCHLDASHNVASAFHVELAWLTASGRIVEGAIQTWTRQVGRYGLALVEVSMRSVLERHNPFQKAMEVRPCVWPDEPWTSDEEDEAEEARREGRERRKPLTKLDYLAFLLRHVDFFLDLGADSTFPAHLDAAYSYRRAPTPHSQFIHRSGTVLAAVLGPTSPSPSPSSSSGAARDAAGDDDDDDEPRIAYAPNAVFINHRPDLDAREPVRRLVELCGDEARLRGVWEAARAGAGAGAGEERRT